jgi:excisionase family DNA binding protein
MSERVLTTREVADELRIAPDTVLRWVESRGLPAYRLTSRAIRYRRAELDAWCAAWSTTDSGRSDRGCQTPGAVPATQGSSREPDAELGSGTRPLGAAPTEEDFYAR